MTILFLDFDGVLHPYAPWPHDETVRAQYFKYLPRLEALIWEFPRARLVVASDWRLHHSLAELRNFFSPDLRERLIGTTELERPTGDGPAQRQLQVEKFLVEHNLRSTPWIAVDDTAENYRPEAHLVLCENCFGADEEAQLRKLLTLLA